MFITYIKSIENKKINKTLYNIYLRLMVAECRQSYGGHKSTFQNKGRLLANVA